MMYSLTTTFLLASVLAGCGPGVGSTCDEHEACEMPERSPGVQGCDLRSFQGSPEGVCIPLVDAGWHTALVRMTFLPKAALRCPPSAPFAGLWGLEVTRPGGVPRRVIGCSVNPLATCAALSFACVPFEEGYPACIHQDGPQVCPDTYPVETRVEKDGEGGDVTVCCPAEGAPG